MPNLLVDSHAHRKARGAFFTPPVISRFVANWALRGATDSVLEPSCGEASFLLAAGDRLRELGAGGLGDMRLHGVELHQASAATAQAHLAERGLAAEIVVGDFFGVQPAPLYDAVLGNPPYVRYQHFTGAARARSLEAALAHGVRLTGLASSWAAFTVHASQFLRPNGRLGLVLPAELLTVNYAAEVRRFLLERFGAVRLVMFEELVFPGVLEEVVLLLAEGQGPAPCFQVYQARDLEDLLSREELSWHRFTPERDSKWTPALLPAPGLEAYRKATDSATFSPMLTWGETYLGAVTGDNRFFTLTKNDLKRSALRASEVRRISPPGSRHLRGLTFSDKAWESLESDEKPCYLFYPKEHELSLTASDYIVAGEATGVHQAYKCRSRKPWWRVPLVAVPDLLLTYMDHERPRLTTNEAGVHHLNSLYGVALQKEKKKLGRELLPLVALNSVTLLGSEMVGRAYGGGLLKLEPKEADKLPVPSFQVTEATAKELRALRPQVGLALRRGELAKAITLVDHIILTGELGLTHTEVQSLREARELLFSRRIARGKSQ